MPWCVLISRIRVPAPIGGAQSSRRYYQLAGLRKWSAVRFVCGLLVSGVVISACGGGSTPGAGSTKKYTMYLSNNYMGNDWRPQMERMATVLADKPPLKGRITLKIQNASQPTPTAQLQDLNNIIATKPDAILIDSSSPDALNATIQRACDAGIVVIGFDQVPSAPCAWKIFEDGKDVGKGLALWLVASLNGTGDVFVDLAIPGFPFSQDLINGYKAVFAANPGIHQTCTFTSQAAIGPEQAGVAACLAAHPRVDGILSASSGVGAMKAIADAGLKPKLIAAGSTNGAMLACATGTQPCGLYSSATWVSGLAEMTAVEILDGKRSKAGGTIAMPVPFLVSNGVNPPGMATPPQKIEIGVNCFQGVDAGVWMPLSPPWTTVTVQEAASGQAS